jgi:acyl-CoA synthetase (AMP-forming)/AMP-acid ligase II
VTIDGAAAGATPIARSAAELVERLDGRGFEQLVDELEHAARAAGDRVLMREGRRTITGTELAHAFDVLPRALMARGMRPGQVVLFGVRPGIDSLLLLLAAMRTGALVTFVDPGVGPELFERRLELLAPDWVMAESLLYIASAPTPLRGYLRRRGFTLPRLAKLPGTHVRVGRRLPFVPRSLSLRQLLDEPVDRAAAGAGALPELDIDAPSLVIFTSGTTGAPKGVQHTGRSVTAAVRLFLEHFELPPDSVMYNHNIHSFVMAILCGVPTVVEPMEFRVDRYLEDLDEHGVTHTFGLPVDAYALVQHCERTGRKLPESLRLMILYSAPVTTGVLERIHAIAHPELRIMCAYAMTEMAPVAWIDSRDKCAWQGEGDVVGPVCRGVEWRIDEHEELHLQGDNAHRGYAGIHPERIEWHATGDLARVDEAGNLVLMGRAKDMLIRGDFNLYPGLYEETASRIPGVGAVAFIGRPDPVTADEAVILYVEPDPRVKRDDEQLARDVMRRLESGDLAIDRKALPDEVRVLDALPRSGRSNKIDRKALRELAAGAAGKGGVGE